MPLFLQNPYAPETPSASNQWGTAGQFAADQAPAPSAQPEETGEYPENQPGAIGMAPEQPQGQQSFQSMFRPITRQGGQPGLGSAQPAPAAPMPAQGQFGNANLWQPLEPRLQARIDELQDAQDIIRNSPSLSDASKLKALGTINGQLMQLDPDGNYSRGAHALRGSVPPIEKYMAQNMYTMPNGTMVALDGKGQPYFHDPKPDTLQERQLKLQQKMEENRHQLELKRQEHAKEIQMAREARAHEAELTRQDRNAKLIESEDAETRKRHGEIAAHMTTEDNISKRKILPDFEGPKGSFEVLRKEVGDERAYRAYPHMRPKPFSPDVSGLSELPPAPPSPVTSMPTATQAAVPAQLQAARQAALEKQTGMSIEEFKKSVGQAPATVPRAQPVLNTHSYGKTWADMSNDLQGR